MESAAYQLRRELDESKFLEREAHGAQLQAQLVVKSGRERENALEEQLQELRAALIESEARCAAAESGANQMKEKEARAQQIAQEERQGEVQMLQELLQKAMKHQLELSVEFNAVREVLAEEEMRAAQLSLSMDRMASDLHSAEQRAVSAEARNQPLRCFLSKDLCAFL